MGERIQVELFEKGSYPWSEWMDGCTWEITQGVDFPSTIDRNNFVNAMHAKARKKGKRCITKKVGDKKIQFMFYVPEGE